MINLEEIVKAIKNLGYIVATNGYKNIIYVGNGVNVLRFVYYDKFEYLIPNFCIEQNYRTCSFNGAGTLDVNHPYISCKEDVTKEILDKAFKGPSWYVKEENSKYCCNIGKIIEIENNNIQQLFLK